MRFPKLIPCITLVVLSSGCVSQNVAHDQSKAREALLDLYEDQFMDNAIRVYLELPWVQLDYSGLGGQTLNTFSASVNATGGGVRNVFSSISSAAASMLRVFNWGVTGNVSDLNSRQMSMTANPVYDQPPGITYLANSPDKDGKMEAKLVPVPALYPIYKKFAETGIQEANPGDFKSEKEFLAKCNVYHHLFRKFDGKYYYVSESNKSEFGKAFYQTTLVRLGVAPSTSKSGGPSGTSTVVDRNAPPATTTSPTLLLQPAF